MDIGLATLLACGPLGSTSEDQNYTEGKINKRFQFEKKLKLSPNQAKASLAKVQGHQDQDRSCKEREEEEKEESREKGRTEG